jgi:polyketide biosynthesis enoyl-CoA hydratase PksI
MSAIIRTEHIEDGIVEVRIDDEAMHNRLSDRLCRDLMAAFAELRADPSLKAVLLTGRPDVFCGGATQDALESVSTGAVDVLDLLLPEQMLAFPVPIVGAIAGHAVGGGLVLALCCDVMIASETSRYGVNFTNMGFTPGMGATALLPAIVGYHHAIEMMLTAKLYRGAELRERGLFNQVVPAADVHATALDIARRMAEKPRHVLEMVKGTLGIARRQALCAGMWGEHLMHQISFHHPDAMRLIAENYVTPEPPTKKEHHG